MASRRSLELEELGQRIAPSVTPISLPSLTIPAALTGEHNQHNPLAGQGHGTYMSNSLNPDVCVSYTLKGKADLAKLGHVTVDGSVHGVGFILSGQATGTLTFTNSHGTVTLDLKGPQQPGFSPLPKDWHYKVTSATGDYQSLKGQEGSLNLTFKPDNSTSANGTFKLKI
jgi:hypothetical protein